MSRYASIDPTRLRWFAEVAEQLHFTRAAKTLGIARQRLSATVIELENELGVRLFVPGAQPTQLTEDGADLLRAAREILSTPAESEPAARTPERLRVGFVPGVTVSKWERIWGERFPDTPLETVPIAAAEQRAALDDGRVDMCFVRQPIERDGLGVIPLYRELPVVVVPKEHEISLFDEVSVADLAGERLQDAADIDQAAVVLEMVAAGVGPAIVPHSIARLHARRDLVYRTVTDHPDTEIALAWPSERTTVLVEEFIGVVRGRSARSSRGPSGPAANAKSTGKQAAGKQATGKQAAGKKATGKKGAGKKSAATGAEKAASPRAGARRGSAGRRGR
ncbi:LysR family transcriptional regulator [Nocardia farcinica]|uniref:LysR family transcriptional regulator n=1 Tax=Nocardia farcinica TaxID=37329 RepID=UPI001893F20D|nr:LysR substrate-binding domain-containing protein [Nocardia farcinica]MBF6250785.1 LysR family transcriptional regulator [Nocardia farcinica]